MRTLFWLGIVVVFFTTSGCAKAISNESRAEVVPAPLPGYTCFAILDAEGKAVGGNCVKE